MATALPQIIEGFEQSLREVQSRDAELGRINSGQSIRLAQRIVELKDWAAEQPAATHDRPPTMKGGRS
jgi:hypothetical protein